jgi:leucyl aminopeptidase
MRKSSFFSNRHCPVVTFSKTVFFLLLILVIMFSTTECTKDDTEKERKEALIKEMVNEINADSLEADVKWLQDMGTRFTLTDRHRRVAVKIQNRFISMGYAEARLDSFFVTKMYRNIEYEQWQYNVIATIAGSEYPDSLCIMGGHYDNIIMTGDPFTLVPGANDNASGVAAVLEVARVMKNHSFNPKNSIMFIAFGAEEIGLLGSLDFAADPDDFSRKISFMLNNDMIAYEPGTDPGLWRVNILDYDNSHRLRRDAEQTALKYVTLSYKNDNTSNKYSDSYPFFRYGYKALFFFSDIVDPNIHTLNDLVSNCNFNYCREIVRLNCAFLANKN